MIRLAIELDTQDGIPRLVESLTVPNPITLRGKRGTKPVYEVRFSRSGTPERLDSGTLLRFTIKEAGKFDGSALVTAWDADWTRPGTETGWYIATVDYDTLELAAVMKSPDGVASNDEDTVTFMGEFSWGQPGEAPTATAKFDVDIENLVNNEGTTTATPAGLRPSVIPELAGYTGGGATKLDGIVTVGLTLPRILWFLHSTEGTRCYVLLAGTDAEASPAIIRPDDYNASTNAKVWKSQF